MNRKTFVKCAAAMLLALGTVSAMAADAWPSRPIRLIVVNPPGGAADIYSRLVAIKMGEKLGQTILVENRAGGDTLVGTRFAKDLPADGYTLLQQGNSFSYLPSMKLEPGYEPLKDFTPLGPTVRGPVVIEVGGVQPDHTLKDFIARAKTTQLSFASPGIGSSPHVAAELMMKKVGIKLQHIPYKGASATYPDVVGGRVPLLVDGYAGSAPYLKSGQFRALAITGAERMTALPDVPTLKELGIDLTYNYWIGLVVKAGTPKDVVQKLSDALKYALSSKEVQDRARTDGVDASFMTPVDFKDYIGKEIADFTKLAAELKLPKD